MKMRVRPQFCSGIHPPVRAAVLLFYKLAVAVALNLISFSTTCGTAFGANVFSKTSPTGTASSAAVSAGNEHNTAPPGSFSFGPFQKAADEGGEDRVDLVRAAEVQSDSAHSEDSEWIDVGAEDLGSSVRCGGAATSTPDSMAQPFVDCGNITLDPDHLIPAVVAMSLEERREEELLPFTLVGAVGDKDDGDAQQDDVPQETQEGAELGGGNDRSLTLSLKSPPKKVQESESARFGPLFWTGADADLRHRLFGRRSEALVPAGSLRQELQSDPINFLRDSFPRPPASTFPVLENSHAPVQSPASASSRSKQRPEEVLQEVGLEDAEVEMMTALRAHNAQQQRRAQDKFQKIARGKQDAVKRFRTCLIKTRAPGGDCAGGAPAFEDRRGRSRSFDSSEMSSDEDYSSTVAPVSSGSSPVYSPATMLSTPSPARNAKAQSPLTSQMCTRSVASSSCTTPEAPATGGPFDPTTFGNKMNNPHHAGAVAVISPPGNHEEQDLLSASDTDRRTSLFGIRSRRLGLPRPSGEMSLHWRPTAAALRDLSSSSSNAIYTIGGLCRRACDWLRQKADDEDEEEQQAREAVDALCLAV